jgi:hypothetical protein
MKKRPVLRRTVAVVLTMSVAILLFDAPSQAFAPKHHLDVTLGALEGAGFSYGQAWLLAYFDIEVDMSLEVPVVFCRWPIRWPTRKYVCLSGLGPGSYNPCAAGNLLNDWAGWCLPFHNCRLSYPLSKEPWGADPAKGLEAFTKMRSLASVHTPLHVSAGQRCYDTMVRFGYMLHGIQDFYAHTNWVEVFHKDLGFEFKDIPTWTSFQKSQRAGKLNLILLNQAGGDSTKAAALYDTLDSTLELGNHAMRHKDTDDMDLYEDENLAYHQDAHGHTVLDFQKEAKFLAGTETYQLGLQYKLNIVNNPKLGNSVWKAQFDCVSEMAAFDGKSYEDELSDYKKGVGRLRTYASSLPFVRLVCNFIGPLLAYFTGSLGTVLYVVPQLSALCQFIPDQFWH